MMFTVEFERKLTKNAIVVNIELSKLETNSIILDQNSRVAH